MKPTIILKSILMHLVFTASLVLIGYSQDPCKTGECSLPGPAEVSGQVIRYGGRFMTSVGTVRVLVVFVRFSDDVETNSNWPDPNVLPSWAQNFVDVNYSASGNYTPHRASQYFYENSYGNFHVIGDVYYVTTSNNEDYYHQLAATSGADAARGAIETEVFNKLDAPPYNVDFHRYDNWTFGRVGTDFVNSNLPDTILDMCWIMSRNLHDENLPAGRAPFAVGRATLNSPTLTKDGITIQGGYPGSGLEGFGKIMYMPLSEYEATDGSYTLVNFAAHEMTHYLFGSNHLATLEFGNMSLSSIRSTSSMKGYAGGWCGRLSLL